MTSYLTDLAKNIIPYIPGEQPQDKKYIKLNTNENPYPASDVVKDAIAREISNLRLYPDPDCKELIRNIASYYGVAIENVFVGNGSDEILAFAFAAFFADKTILFPDITYSFYPVCAQLFHVNYSEIPVASDFSINPEDYFCPNGGIFIANPNAPTGKFMPLDELKKIIESNFKFGSIVLVDEAYIDFGGLSAVNLVNTYPNLLVVQTFSKSRSLAGLRVGFAIGNKALIEGLNRIKNAFNSYTLDRLALAAASAAILDNTQFDVNRTKIIHTREWVISKLKTLGFDMPESKANFIFIKHKTKYAEDIFKELRHKGILVRYFKKNRIDNYLRVTIGTDEEMTALFAALQEICM